MHRDPLCMYINMDVHISKLVSCMSNNRYQEQSESNQNRKMRKYFQLTQRPKDYLLPSRHRELRKNAEGRRKRYMHWRTSGAENTHMANHQIIPNFNGEQRNTKQKQTFDFLHRLGGTKILHLAKLPLGPSLDPSTVNHLEQGHCRSRSTLFGTWELQFGIDKSRRFRMGTPKTPRFASGFERQGEAERKFLKLNDKKSAKCRETVLPWS